MKVKLLLVAEMEVEGEEPSQEAQDKLDAFREAIQPGQEYGITLSRAQLPELEGFVAAQTNCLAEG
jgi:hypothetical protein